MKKTKRILSAALAAVLLATAAAGCQKSEQGAANGKTVIVGAATDLKTLDTGYMYEVYGNMVSYSLYDMLFRIEGEDMSNPKPSLVTDKWTLDETGTIYTLPIREGVKFSSGNPLTAADVVWSIQRVMGLKDSSNQAHVAGIQSVEAKDDHTVVITLKAPDASYLTKLASNAYCILDSKLVKENGGSTEAGKDTAREYLNKNSAGSGPFILESWTPENELSMKKNPNYWGSAGNVERVVIKEYDDANTQIQALEKGEIDIALSVNSDNVAQLKGKDGVTIKNAQAAVCSFLLMNNDPAIGKEMANPKVQQAVRYAIDYEGLKKMCGEGASLPLSIVPQGFVGAKNRPDNYRNLDKAKALMKEAGYENGFTVELTAANFDTEGMKWPDIAQKIQADLKEIKIDVKIVTSEFSVMVDPYRKGELPFLVMHWSPDYFDINNQLAFLPGSTVGERAKCAADGHQDMIDLGNKIIGESDKTLRAQYSEQLQDLMAENSPYAFLLQHPKVYAYRTNLSNVSYCDLCKIQLKDLTVN